MTTTMMMTTDPIGGGSSTSSLDETGSEDNLFSTYIDVDKLTGGADSINGGRNGADQTATTSFKGWPNGHRHSNSVDGYCEIMEANKAMPPDKLAELWNIDPKRAKRILANRQSAARSKERKALYILERERKVQTLQTEATTLSAQLTLFQINLFYLSSFQFYFVKIVLSFANKNILCVCSILLVCRDTMGLSAENTELKFRLQAMEQQAQFRDAFSETLEEVERLKIATGEMIGASESFNLGMHAMPYSSSNHFGVPQPPGAPAGHQNMQLQPLGHSQSSRAAHHLQQTNSQPTSDILMNDQLGRFQGLDVSSGGQTFVKYEVPSLCAIETSTIF